MAAWPVLNNTFAPPAGLLEKGYEATKAGNGGTQVWIHTADADSMANARWFYHGIRAQGVQWDVTALPHYRMWHGMLSNLHNVIVDTKQGTGGRS